MKVSIDPITRLEGHGKIEIFLDEKGNVEKAYMQIPELRGFEMFCRGRKAEDMPIITARICGVCPEAHHMAAAKALDDAFNVEPPETAKLLRELLYNAYMFYDHCLHLYYLGGIDVLLGDVPKEERNVIGLIKKFGMEIGKEVVKHRRYAMEIVKMLGGREIHPVAAVPGGVSKGIGEDERKEIEEKAKSCIEFAKTSLSIFKEVFESKRWNELLGLDSLQTYYMGLVDKNNHVNYYDGDIRIVTPSGKEFAKIKAKDILNHIEEHVEEWTYVKFPYLKKVGWKGFVDGEKSGIYRVGPLARLNAADGMNTKEAMKEFEEFKKDGVVHETFAFYHARLIEMLNAAERMYDLARHNAITGTDIRAMPNEPDEGIGVVEAARGVLIHHYKLNSHGIVEEANLIVATTNNNAAINMSVANAAKKVIKKGKVDDIILNKVESAFRCYDPCLACASHALGDTPLVVNIYRGNKLYKRLEKNV
ncbi:MAG TPA: Ni/Fe hydrogenase subunit alpha [Thermoplasmatales archaeon]|nr:Ni/Fe hydrogenase subunit alpha [Thermoplasmatales archaeon]